MPNRIVGLDITNRRVLGVEVLGAASGKPKISRVHAVELPDGVARDSEVVDIAAVSQALKQLWKTGDFKSKRVVIGVGNQRVLVRDYTAPVMPLAQLRQALPYQVADLLPVPVGETILDFYPIAEVEGSAPPQMHGLLVAAIKEGVELNVAAIEDAGLKVGGVDLSPFALVRALGGSDQLDGHRTVLFLGDRSTYIVVVSDGVPQFVRIIPAGSDTITEAIEEATGLPPAEAEALKLRIGAAHGGEAEHATASEAILQNLRNIAGSVRNTNAYYQANFAGASATGLLGAADSADTAVTGIVVAGRETRVPGLVAALGELVGLPASVANALTGVAVAGDVDAQTLSQVEPEIAIALGLALGSK